MGEKLIKPAAIDMVRIMCGDEVAEKFALVPLSDDTAQKHIASMSLNAEEQLVSSIKQGEEYSLQIDESTDVSDDAQ